MRVSTLIERCVIYLKKFNWLVVLSVISGAALLASNLAATKIFSFFGVPVDAGLFIYPLTYIIGDLILMICSNEEKLRRFPKMVVWTSMLVNLAIMGILYMTIKLPGFPGWENQEAYAAIFGFMPRIVIGSLAGYLTSNLVNIVAFKRIRSTKQKQEVNEDGKIVIYEKETLFSRAYGSSVIAKIFDVVIFEIIAFAGVLPLGKFIVQMIFAYGLGLLAELPLSVLACAIYAGMTREKKK